MKESSDKQISSSHRDRESYDLNPNTSQLSGDRSTLRREWILTRKRQLSKDAYHNPEIAAKKRKQARDAYKNPLNAQRKRKQAKEAYQNPEKAQKKRQASKKLYQTPEKGQKKCQQARQTSKDAYQHPEKAQKKRQASKKLYQIPEKAQRKRQQARKTSKDAYQHPEKAQKKQQVSKKAYKNPEIRAMKIQQSQSNRLQRETDTCIEDVIANFKDSCNNSQQLIYICQICQRVHFKHQGQLFKKNNYSKRVLLKCFPPGCTIDDLPESQHDDDNTVWICHTCNQNIRYQKVAPRLAIGNKLNLQEQPPELSRLNMLERHLISPAIPFMKMVPLIKGAQKGIHGQVVCVKAEVNTTAMCLPQMRVLLE